MEINLRNAVNKFYPNPSLEMVYFEAIANAIDANAKNINVSISIEAFNKPETLRITIEDDGDGFTDNNFEKFSRLLEYKDKYHKGLGRLVYLQYFKEVKVKSVYRKGVREFSFTEDFDKKCEVKITENKKTGSLLEFEDYYKGTIKTYDYLLPESLIEKTKIHFYPTLYSRKLDKNHLSIKFSLSVKESNPKYRFVSGHKELIAEDLPDLRRKKIDTDQLGLFTDVELLYNIKKDYQGTSVTTVINVDKRTIPLDLLSKEDIPQGYEMFFLLRSSYFDGKSGTTRESLDIEKSELEIIKQIFTESVNEVLHEHVPQINERNKKVLERVNSQFPHLNGYVSEKGLGYIKKEKVLEEAQRKFFQDQKRILEAEDLSDSQYDDALNISSA